MPNPVDIRDEIEIKEVPAQPVLIIRERAPLEKMSEVIPAAFAEIEDYMRELGIRPTGAPITVCPYADDEGVVAVQNSFPVDDGIPGRGRIEALMLPACTVLAYEHRGHYKELDRSYRALTAFAEQVGLETAGEPREIYWTDPEELPPDEWRTEIQFPIVRDEARIAALTVTMKT